jgi:hypothetical protein
MCVAYNSTRHGKLIGDNDNLRSSAAVRAMADQQNKIINRQLQQNRPVFDSHLKVMDDTGIIMFLDSPQSMLSVMGVMLSSDEYNVIHALMHESPDFENVSERYNILLDSVVPEWNYRIQDVDFSKIYTVR